VVFVTDGSHSPARAGQSPEEARDLARVRRDEALAALAVLGVPAANAVFLDFEDGTLERSGSELEAAIVEQVRQRGAAFVFVPFRYDRHPDHLAINRAARAARRRGAIEAAVVEYFIYSQWRLLRSGDVRDYLAPELLRRLEAGPAMPTKRRALECHRSQTTGYFDWQARPILTAELLDRVCAEPETFLVQDPACEGRRVLARGRTWVPIAHRVEPVLKRWKDRLVGWKGA
jgi:LmbE family N-acetylglucosaminyl deacetylase